MANNPKRTPTEAMVTMAAELVALGTTVEEAVAKLVKLLPGADAKKARDELYERFPGQVSWARAAAKAGWGSSKPLGPEGSDY